MNQAPPRPSSKATSEDPNISLGSIFEELKSDVAAVLGGTFALLRQELSENTERIRKATTTAIAGAITITIGGLFLVTAINLAAIDFLAPQYMSAATAAWVCTAITGTVMVVAGIVFTKRNAKKLKPEELIPSRTLESLEHSFEWAVDKAEDAARR